MTEPIAEFENEYRWLSNFWMSDVKMYGKIYPSVEHAYQAAKTLDLALREKMRLCKTAAGVKKMGRKLVIREDWESIKISVMEELVTRKFQNTELRAKLLATGDAELIEGNWWKDFFWGVCNGVGENNLGKILMRIRDKIRKE